MALSRVLSPTLIGREPELSLLEDALLSAMRGDGGVVIVGGEAGLGKTRLVNTLAERARRLNCVVLTGACSEAELALPYLPFLEAIGNYLATAEVSRLRDRIGSAGEELAQLFPQMGRPASTGGDATQAKLRLFESIMLLLRDASISHALLLILEDLQWADPATRELLDYATRRLRSSNVLVVATYRSDEMHRKHALLPTIQGWRRNGQVDLIELHPFGSEGVADMVCAIFEEGSISAEFRDFLHERSEGNPFVLEEMLRDALDRGDIFKTEKGWDRKGVAEMRIPRTVRDTILQRLERLGRDDVAVLSAASVMGRSFDLDSLIAVSAVDEGLVLSALEASVTAQLLEEEGTSGRYRFRHALTREAVYEDLVVPRRQQLHSRVADVLSSRPEHAAVDLANHLLMAGRYEEAVAMCVAAAEDADRARAYRDAAELLERAAPHVRDTTERARLLCRAADSYWNNAEPAKARRLLEPAIADLESAGLLVEAAGHRIMLGRCFWELMRSDLAQEQLLKAKETLEPEGPSEALALAYVRLSGFATFDERLAEGLDYAKRAAETAEKAGAGLARAWSWNFMALAEIGLGQVDAGFAHLEESYQAAIAGNYRFQVGNAVYNAAWIAIHLADGDKTKRWGSRGGASPLSTDSWLPYIRSFVALESGRVTEAIDLARSALQKGRDAGHQKMVWRASVLLAHALAENLLVTEAASTLPALTTRVDGQDSIYDTHARVRVRLAADDPDGALEDAKTVSPDGCHLASPVDAISEVANDAPWLRSFMEAIPAEGQVLASPRLAVANGRLALLEGRIDDALRDLRASVEAFEKGGFTLDTWHAGRSLAEVEARAGDLVAAQKRLESISAAADSAGARLAAKLARETAERLGLEVSPGLDGAGGTQEDAPRIAAGERMVSVLFADVRGYSEMSGLKSPAEMADRIAALQRWASQEIAKRHGIVDKFAGDAVMATFNVSGQTVDHTIQALQAAMAIIDKASMAGLPVGAGIAVGPAIVGTLADSANMSVLGEVTNMAARLQAQSAAGQVTLTEEAFRRVRARLEEKQIQTERLELRLKGFDGPVTAFRVASATAERKAT
jgi:class 3 adenylate cyclase